VTAADTTPGTPSRAARVITEVCSPAVVVVLLPLAVAWHATGHQLGRTVLWGLVVAVFAGVLPMVFIVRGARLGRWDGLHVRNRDGRTVPLLLCLGSTALGLAILLFGHAPRDVTALDVAMPVTLFACTIVTRWWKISLRGRAGDRRGADRANSGWRCLFVGPMTSKMA
jgi:cobalamin synthase